MQDVSTTRQDTGSGARIVYILYLASLVIGITGIIGLVMAYIKRGEAPEWLQSHYQWQIRTFWLGLLYTVIGALTAFILIGYLILLCNLIWFIIRCVKDLSALEKQQPLSKPTSWLF